MKYVFTPQIASRVKDVFGSGFYFTAYFIALVYSAVRLLPANHPYVDAKNIGKYGIRHVIAEAANSLQITRHNIDRILLFFLVILGLFIGAAQIFVLVISLFMQTAQADGFADMFVTNAPADDLAYMFMDLVFGVQGMFNSCISTAAECVSVNGKNIDESFKVISANGFPFPVHKALHQMMAVYSTGLSIIGMMIMLYFVATIVAETAQTGTPFGKRFSHLWAPLRIVTAFALIVPVGSGLSSAQYLVLYSAKFGSSFATNSWVTFNDTLSEEYTSDMDSLISVPNSPDVTSLLRFLFLAKTCAYNYAVNNTNIVGGEGEDLAIKPYMVRTVSTSDLLPSYVEIKPSQVLNSSKDSIESYGIATWAPYISEGESIGLWDYANGSDSVDIVFGLVDPTDPTAYSEHTGGVLPLCGKMQFKLTDVRIPPPIDSTVPAGDTTDYANPGVDALQRFHWYAFQVAYFSNEYFYHLQMLEDSDTKVFFDTAWSIGNKHAVNSTQSTAQDDVGFPLNQDPSSTSTHFPAIGTTLYESDLQVEFNGQCGDNDWEDEHDNYGSCGFFEDVYYGKGILPVNKSVVEMMKDASSWSISEPLRNKGWAGAGVWYNKLAELNGAAVDAALNLPRPVKFPMVMEYIAQLRTASQNAPNLSDIYNPEGVDLVDNPDLSVIDSLPQHATAMQAAYKEWKSVAEAESSGNAFIDTIKTIFGVEGLYNMRENRDVHPLAQLVGLGKTLVESAIRNIGYSAALKTTSPLIHSLSNSLHTTVGVVSGFVVTVTMVALTIGVLLFYFVPFMPFIYFFFAVSGWVKGIFEALVGVPLWALAHIRIDGNGLPGQAAMNGYYLLLEIFIRPILTVFGLLASISIFAALVGVLGDIWGEVLDNVGGFDVAQGLNNTDATGLKVVLDNMGSEIDQFFYTVVYAIIVYMIGMSSFKLIDAIPNNILRWMGSGVTAFNDGRENPAEGMAGTGYSGISMASNSLESALAIK